MYTKSRPARREEPTSPQAVVPAPAPEPPGATTSMLT